MGVIYKITYPNGKIYIGKDLTDSNNFRGYSTFNSKRQKQVLPEYLALVLNSKPIQMQAERDAGGSIILHWRVSEIENVIVLIVDYNNQQEISDKIEENFHLKKQSEQLLELAKIAVEKAIEEGEEVVIGYQSENVDTNA